MVIKLFLKRLLAILLTFYVLNVEAQVENGRSYIIFDSDSIQYAENIRLRRNFVNSLQLRVDSKPISLQGIKFFKNDEGFFAVTKKRNILDQVIVSERVIEGRINVFRERSYATFKDSSPYVHYNLDVDQVSVRMHYNKDYGDLKKVNYTNLRVDMADDMESLNLLKGYRKNVNISKGLYSAAGVSLAAAIISFIVKDKGTRSSFNNGIGGNSHVQPVDRRTNYVPSFVLFGVGAGLGIGGYVIDRAGLQKLETAIDTYNK